MIQPISLKKVITIHSSTVEKKTHGWPIDWQQKSGRNACHT